MYDLQTMQSRQAQAVVREYREALEDGAVDLAWRIYRANPDIFPPVRHYHMWRDTVKAGAR